MSTLSQIAIDLIPHGYGLSWQPHLLWLHGIAHLVTASADGAGHGMKPQA